MSVDFWIGFVTGPFVIIGMAIASAGLWGIVKPARYPAWLFSHETVYGPVGKQGVCWHQHTYRQSRWFFEWLARWDAKRAMRRCHAERLRGIDNYARYDPYYKKGAS